MRRIASAEGPAARPAHIAIRTRPCSPRVRMCVLIQLVQSAPRPAALVHRPIVGAGSVAFHARRGAPAPSRDLTQHTCSNWHPTRWHSGSTYVMRSDVASCSRFWKSSARRSQATTCIIRSAGQASRALRAFIHHLHASGAPRAPSALGADSDLFTIPVRLFTFRPTKPLSSL
jgi:hypothetical protein